MVIPAKERERRALVQRLPPGKERDRAEQMLPDRKKALARFRKYAQRAEQELPGWELNWMSEHICNLLGEDMFVLRDEINAEEAEHKRMEGRLKVVGKDKRAHRQVQ